MNLDESGETDRCERLLQASLARSDNLSYHARKQLEDALDWYQGEQTEPLSLVGWMTVSRTVGENIAIRLDTGDEYHYLRFDIDRNRVVLIDPHTYNQVPVEETSVSTLFKEASVSLIPAERMRIKTYDAITVVTNETHGTKVVLGRYTDEFTQYQAEEGAITYTAKTNFSLPEPMTPPEIDDWLNSDESETVKKIIRTNHELNWGN